MPRQPTDSHALRDADLDRRRDYGRQIRVHWVRCRSLCRPHVRGMSVYFRISDDLLPGCWPPSLSHVETTSSCVPSSVTTDEAGAAAAARMSGARIVLVGSAARAMARRATASVVRGGDDEQVELVPALAGGDGQGGIDTCEPAQANHSCAHHESNVVGIG